LAPTRAGEKARERVAGVCEIDVKVRQRGFVLEIGVSNPLAREPVQREGNQIGLKQHPRPPGLDLRSGGAAGDARAARPVRTDDDDPGGTQGGLNMLNVLIVDDEPLARSA